MLELLFFKGKTARYYRLTDLPPKKVYKMGESSRKGQGVQGGMLGDRGGGVREGVSGNNFKGKVHSVPSGNKVKDSSSMVLKLHTSAPNTQGRLTGAMVLPSLYTS